MKRRALSTLMALSLFCAGGAAMADGAYTPGTYTVSADGNNGAITLRVEMTADAIADIKVVSQSETAGLGDVAIDKMIEAILVAGNTDVDTVSQATVSSEAVIAAVNAALSRAEKGEVDTVASPVAEAVTEETLPTSARRRASTSPTRPECVNLRFPDDGCGCGRYYARVRQGEVCG